MNPVNPLLKPVHKMFFKAVKAADPGVATTGAVAASKLMLLNILRDPDLLKALTIAYFNPESQHNPGLRQALTYFLPVYCHSRKDNAERMASIAVSVVHVMRGVQEDLEEEGDVEMVGIGVVGSQIVDWTDPRKLVGADDTSGKLVTGETKIEGLGDAHLILAEDLLEKVLTQGTTSKYSVTLHLLLIGTNHYIRGREEDLCIYARQVTCALHMFPGKGPIGQRYRRRKPRQQARRNRRYRPQCLHQAVQRPRQAVCSIREG